MTTLRPIRKEHTHITQQAHPLGSCPACDVVWHVAMDRLSGLIDFEQEFAVARSLRNDYGEKEMLHHLTDVMSVSQKILYKIR